MQEQQEAIAGGCCRTHDRIGAMEVASRSLGHEVRLPDLLVTLAQQFIALPERHVALTQDLVAFPNCLIALTQEFIALPERLVALAQVGIALGKSLIPLAQQLSPLRCQSSSPGSGLFQLAPQLSARVKAGQMFKQPHEPPQTTTRR